MRIAPGRADRRLGTIAHRGTSLLKIGAALVAMSAGVERFLHEKAPPDFPRVSTRGHFEVHRRRGWPGAIGRALTDAEYGYVRLVPGHTASDYRTVGAIPGDDTDDVPAELLIFVHGWFADETVALGRLSKMAYELDKAGYPHPAIGFTWDATHGWGPTFDIADRNGPKLAAFVADYKRAHPETAVRLLSNSIAARTVFEAVSSLHRRGEADLVTSASTLVAGVDSRSVARSGRYGPAIESVVGAFHNYWHENDLVLNTVYRFVEDEPALGGTGVVGEPPPNYVDHDIAEVPDHISVYRSDVGCIPRVVDDFDD